MRKPLTLICLFTISACLIVNLSFSTTSAAPVPKAKPLPNCKECDCWEWQGEREKILGVDKYFEFYFTIDDSGDEYPIWVAVPTPGGNGVAGCSPDNCKNLPVVIDTDFPVRVYMYNDGRIRCGNVQNTCANVDAFGLGTSVRLEDQWYARCSGTQLLKATAHGVKKDQ